jgi:hypothetical protein
MLEVGDIALARDMDRMIANKSGLLTIAEGD